MNLSGLFGKLLRHAHLWEMLATARDAGCRTGFTTNGVALTAGKIERALDEEVGIISVSLAGAGEARHGSLRRGAPWKTILSNLELLVRSRSERGLNIPWIELHFLMMRSNLEDLPEFVRMASEIGVDEVVATNLTATPTQALDGMRVFDWQPEQAHLRLVEEAQRAAKRAGIGLRTYPLEMNADVLACAAQPETTVYITSQGEIAPCVYLGMNVKGDIRRTFLGESSCVPRMIFGNARAGLADALGSPERQDFLDTWRARKVGAPAWARLAMLSDGGGDGWELPPVPASCETCYKRYGV